MTFARRLLAVAAATCALSLVAVAPPSSAQTEPRLTITRPEGESVFREAEPRDDLAVLVVEGTITADHPIARVDFTFDPGIDSDSGGGCEGELLTSPGEAFTIDQDMMGGSFKYELTSPCNRSYTLRARIIYEEPVPPLEGFAPPPSDVEDGFSVAIPPTRVRGLEATYDAASREVRLTWAPNPEPDVIGYYIERSLGDGDDRFSRISGEAPVEGSGFTDRDVNEEQRYRVVAVRSGPTGNVLLSDPSLPQTAGPAPSRDVPNVPAAPRSPERASGGGTRPSGSSGASSRPSSPARNQDNVFEESLPFDPSRTTTIPPQELASPGDDAAVLTEVDGASDEDGRRATFVPVAGGLALIVGAMHLFLLSRQAGEAEIPIVPR